MLVPLDPQDEQEVHQPKASHSTGGSGKRLKAQEDGEFSPLRFTDHMGVAQEQRKILIIRVYVLDYSNIKCTEFMVY